MLGPASKPGSSFLELNELRAYEKLFTLFTYLLRGENFGDLVLPLPYLFCLRPFSAWQKEISVMRTCVRPWSGAGKMPNFLSNLGCKGLGPSIWLSKMLWSAMLELRTAATSLIYGGTALMLTFRLYCFNTPKSNADGRSAYCLAASLPNSASLPSLTSWSGLVSVPTPLLERRPVGCPSLVLRRLECSSLINVLALTCVSTLSYIYKLPAISSLSVSSPWLLPYSVRVPGEPEHFDIVCIYLD